MKDLAHPLLIVEYGGVSKGPLKVEMPFGESARE
jgi:hypothetical protein